MEFYSALKREEILHYATAWVNLEDIILNEINQSQKDQYYLTPLVSKIFKFTESKSGMMAARG